MIKVIGLVGTFGSGKGTVAMFLENMGYVTYVLSDIIRDELNKEGILITRESLQNMGNSLRAEHGNDVLTTKTVKKIKKEKSKLAVVDGVRNPAELNYLKNSFDNCLIISITACLDTRFKLLSLRNKPSDPKSIKELKRLAKREVGVGEGEHGQQVQRCLDMADIQIENEGTLEDLKREVELVLKRSNF